VAFDAALAELRRAPVERLREFGLPLTQGGQLWVDRVPEDRSRRALVAAAVALEAQAIRAERGGWMMTGSEPPCAGPCVLEWACALLPSRGAPDEAERDWLLASVALAGGVRDWLFLSAPLTPPTPRTQERGHLVHARARFPDEPRFRLARAVAIASRLAVLPEMNAPRDGERTGPAPTAELIRIVGLPGAAGDLVAERRTAQFAYASRQFLDLAEDPLVGAEALMRLSYLDYRAGAYDTALARARQAATTGADRDVKYVAFYLAAQAAQALGDLGGAEALLTSALEARPHSQSATIGLAALRYRRGDAEPAYALIEASLRERPTDDDPWRMFLYGDFARLPSLIARLRQRIGGAP
jgi:tetratricopeptide (TPR) repeat protein